MQHELHAQANSFGVTAPLPRQNQERKKRKEEKNSKKSHFIGVSAIFYCNVVARLLQCGSMNVYCNNLIIFIPVTQLQYYCSIHCNSIAITLQ